MTRSLAVLLNRAIEKIAEAPTLGQRSSSAPASFFFTAFRMQLCIGRFLL
jgi:hypothetical protein